ncbi:cytokinin-N-glucosyltransferase [Vigna unguiculata]|uniref:Cytokinin-N-glucosyltransferase n=1 Tax=Vigna unguiculata TaxID=3917 RepID=A0A4D6MCK6_VIGUN|nr:cytokinin-N-glucosyltransferase [Vigna unguiculata]
MAGRKGRRWLLTPLPLQGHINPMLELAQILYSEGFSITIIHTTFNSPHPSNYPHFTFSCIQHGVSQTQSSDLLNFLLQLNVKCVEPFKDCVTKLLRSDEAAVEPVACLISDAMCYFTQAVADNLHLPRIVLRTAAISSYVAFLAYPLFRQRGYIPTQDCILEEEVKELAPLRVKDLPLIKTEEPEKYYELLRNFLKETKASLGVIWNSFEGLESPALRKLSKEFSIPMFPIGPFHKHLSSSSSSSSLISQDQSCIAWLDTHPPNSVVYVSFGSLAAITETEFVELAWGLANSRHPFLWVVRPGLIKGSEWVEALPSGFLENLEGRGAIVKWAPQQEVLAHSAVGAFWTHCGWNSTLESICEGVPMICMPIFTDQKVNARYVSHVWRVGLQLEKRVEREEIQRIITTLMDVNGEAKEIRDRALKLKEEAELCLRQGGSSRSSLQALVTYILSFDSFTSQPSSLYIPFRFARKAIDDW